APAIDLGRGPDARRTRVTDPLRRHGSGLADDQPSARALAEIWSHQVIRDSSVAGARTLHRRHHDAVAKFNRPHLDGVKQCGHIETDVGKSGSDLRVFTIIWTTLQHRQTDGR